MRRRRNVVALLGSLAILGGGGIVVCPAVAGASTAGPPALPALPPALQALEQKMEQLQVTSETYIQTEQGTSTIKAAGAHGIGRRHTHVIHSFNKLAGQVSLSPLQADVTDVTAATPKAVEIGSDVYLYIGSLAPRDHGRPWVHFSAPHSAAFELFPYHGASSAQLSLGGSGPYAGLIDLLATASAPTEEVGLTSVDGQQVIEFIVMVNPLRLVSSRGARELAVAFGAGGPRRLELFLAPSGLPVRVVITTRSHLGPVSSLSTKTTDVTSLNSSFAVLAPPVAQTIDEAQFEKQLGPLGGPLEHLTSSAPKPGSKSKQ